MNRHRDKLSKNPRIGMVYRNLDRMDERVRSNTPKRAEQILQNLESV